MQLRRSGNGQAGLQAAIHHLPTDLPRPRPPILSWWDHFASEREERMPRSALIREGGFGLPGRRAALRPAPRPGPSRAPARAGRARRAGRGLTPLPRLGAAAKGRGAKEGSTTNQLDCKSCAALYSRAWPRGWEPRAAGRAGVLRRPGRPRAPLPRVRPAQPLPAPLAPPLPPRPLPSALPPCSYGAALSGGGGAHWWMP